MGKGIIFAGIVAAGVAGFFVGKKLIENNPEAVAAVKENCSDKFQKASVFCSGAIRTGSEKLSKSMNNIVTAGKEKGAVVIDKVKSTGNSFKNEITNLKDMVVSINKDDIEVDLDEDDEELGDVEVVVSSTDDGEDKKDDFTFSEETDAADAEEAL